MKNFTSCRGSAAKGKVSPKGGRRGDEAGAGVTDVPALPPNSKRFKVLTPDLEAELTARPALQGFLQLWHASLSVVCIF